MDESIIVEALEVGPFFTNCYIVGRPNSSAFIVDPGDDPQRLKDVVTKNGFKPEFVINTHGHIDHIGQDSLFGVPVFIHSQDRVLLGDPDLNLSVFLSAPFTVPAELEIKELEDGNILEFLGQSLEVIHTPGHSKGSLCFKFGNYLFSGDTLFYRSIGRTDFKGSSHSQLVRSITEKLFPLDDDLVVLPGHGSRTVLGQEKKENPFLV